MKTQGQISLALAAAVTFAFLVLSSERFSLLFAGFGLLLVAFVARAGIEGELAPRRLVARFFGKSDEAVGAISDDSLSLDHTMHRVFPL